MIYRVADVHTHHTVLAQAESSPAGEYQGGVTSCYPPSWAVASFAHHLVSEQTQTKRSVATHHLSMRPAAGMVDCLASLVPLHWVEVELKTSVPWAVETPVEFPLVGTVGIPAEMVGDPGEFPLAEMVGALAEIVGTLAEMVGDLALVESL